MRFGSPPYWKTNINVVSELEDEFYHFHYVYTEVEYLDINDDFEYIDFLRVSILKNSLWRWKKELKKAFPKLDVCTFI